MFDEHFPPHCASTVMRWTPKWSKSTDPSGRYVYGTQERQSWANENTSAIAIHEAKYDDV
jgi:asparagine synthase (glutamine-hydrolysing)